MKAKKASTRLISILLCCLLTIGLLPITAFAAASDFSCVLIGSKDITTQEKAELTTSTGKVTWDADTATLTLDSVNLKELSLYGKTYGIVIEANDSSKTVTVVLKGTNYIGTEEQTASGTAFYANCNLVIKGEPGSSLNIKCKEDTYGANAIYSTNAISIEGATLNLSSDYPAIYTDSTLDIKDSQVVAEATDGTAIYSVGKTKISGESTKVTANGYYCALLAGGGVEMSNAEFVGHTKDDHIIYTKNGGIALDNAKVTLTSDYDNATGLFVDNDSSKFTISDSILNIETGGTSVFSQKDITITDSELNLTSGANGINAWGKLTISGDKTNIENKSKSPIVGGTVEITSGTVKSETTGGTAIYSDEKGGIIISGGNVYAKTTAAMSAIYTKKGDITIQGSNTSVEAISTQDSAIFARDGKITLDAAPIKATAADGFAAIVARNSYEKDTESAVLPSIEIGENYTAGDNTVVTTVWKTDDNGDYYADAVFAPTGTQGPLENLSNLPNSIIIKLKDADYGKVDEAIAKANALNKEDYKDFSAVEDAINAVVRGKNITEQTEVDGYVTAIENAISALEYKDADYTKVDEAIANANALNKEEYKDFSAVEAAVAAVVRGKNITEQAEVDAMAKAINDAVSALEKKSSIVPGTSTDPSSSSEPSNSSEPSQNTGNNTTSPQTGDNSNMWLWIALLFASGVAVTTLAVVGKKKKKANR